MFIDRRILGLFAGLWLLTTFLTFDIGYSVGRISILAAPEGQPVFEMAAQEVPVVSSTVKRLPPYDFSLVRRAEHVSHVLNVDLNTAWRISKEIDCATERYPTLDFWLIIGIIEVESGGDPHAVSHAGAIGLMQIMPRTGEEVAGKLGMEWNGPADLYDLEASIQMGSFYLDWLIKRFGSMEVALAAYNWGPGHIAKRISRGSMLPVQYPGKVLQAAYRPV